MSQYKRLLLLADISSVRSPAFERAVAIAKATGAGLHLVAFVREPSWRSRLKARHPERDQLHQDDVSDARTMLEVEATRLRSEGLAVTSDVIDGARGRASVLGYIAELAPDLVLKDADRHGHLRRVFFRSLDWTLLRKSPAPVLLVKPSIVSLPRRIAVAADLPRDALAPELNDRIVRFATGYALHLNTDLELACSLELPSPQVESLAQTATGTSDDIDEPDDRFQRDRQERMSRMRRSFESLARRHSVPEASANLLFGRADQTLPGLVDDHDLDTVVIGSASHDVLDRWLGRTGEALVEKIPCDVLVARP